MGVHQVPEAEADSKRKVKRARVLLAAKIQTAKGEMSVRLRDLSQKGALIECDSPPPVNSEVVFSRSQTVVQARVAWSAGGKAGLQFHEPIDESEVLVHVARPTVTKPAEPESRFRRPPVAIANISARDRKLAQMWGVQVGITVPND